MQRIAIKYGGLQRSYLTQCQEMIMKDQRMKDEGRARIDAVGEHIGICIFRPHHHANIVDGGTGLREALSEERAMEI